MRMSVTIVDVTSRHQTEIGSLNSRGSTDVGTMLTGDSNIVELGFVVVWQVRDPVKYIFKVADPEDVPEGQTLLDRLNPQSLEVLRDAKVEPSLGAAVAEQRFQFERLGYFCVDTDSAPGALVFNRTVTLRDTWAKIEKASRPGG